jgi:hypothetical protein
MTFLATLLQEGQNLLIERDGGRFGISREQTARKDE